ncbi:MAG: hypothetical protein CVU43_07500 [Chloroflexi bacterium HGW-Chloroflexi-5]|jgi:hypothetical protein|nr:MAG: hypothetical protein CVU43_07500 [Chloroflexi bacterium HGW-Chloroflexi-5]
MEDQADQLRRQLPPWHGVWITGLVLGGIGLVGLVLLFILTVPTLGPRWLMFFLVTLAVCGFSLPVMHYLHRRFPSKPAATGGVLVREAILVGAYADVMLWLQFGRTLNFALAAFIAAGLIAIELLIRLRERNTWSPPAEE